MKNTSHDKIQAAKIDPRNLSKEIQKQNDLLESLFSSTHFLIALLDDQFNFIRVSRAYANIVGKTPAYFVGKNHFDLYPHEENEKIFNHVKETGQAFSTQNKAFDYPEGPIAETTYWDWTLKPVNNHQDRANRFLLELVNSTEEKRWEKAKQESEKNYRELKEKSLDGYARTNFNGQFVEVNKAFENLIGYSEQELLGLTYEDITPKKWKKREALYLKKLDHQEVTPLYEKEYIKKDGTVISVELRSYLIKDKNNKPNGKWAFVRDITRRKKVERNLKLYARELKKSNRALKEFVYIASHDLQEPLRKIITFGHMLSNLGGPFSDDTAKDYLTRMINASLRMRTLIQELLKYSRISEKRTDFRLVDLNAVFKNVLSNLETRIEKTQSEVKVVDLPKIYGDSTQMLQLFQNLIANAIKFQHENASPRITIDFIERQYKDKTELNRQHSGKYYEINVKDNGIGINEKRIDDIFIPFHRLHGRMEYEGVGMGLAICKKIVDRHNGIIFAKNNPDRGATFTISLPKPRLKAKT